MKRPLEEKDEAVQCSSGLKRLSLGLQCHDSTVNTGKKLKEGQNSKENENSQNANPSSSELLESSQTSEHDYCYINSLLKKLHFERLQRQQPVKKS